MKLIKVDTKDWYKCYDSILIKPKDLPSLEKELSEKGTKIIGMTDIEREPHEISIMRGDPFESSVTDTEQIIFNTGRGSMTR